MATQAAARQARRPASAPKPKILRIGIIQGGRIVEERLVRKRENITIGQSAKNMFVVPSDALPRNWLLFEVERQPATSRTSPTAWTPASPSATRSSRCRSSSRPARSRSAGTSWVLPLDERSRGKITLGRHDDPVPVRHAAAAAAAAAAARVGARLGRCRTSTGSSRPSRRSRSCFTSLLVIYLRNVDWPRKPDIEEIPDRFVQMVVKKEEKKPEEKKEVAEKKPKKRRRPRRRRARRRRRRPRRS